MHNSILVTAFYDDVSHNDIQTWWEDKDDSSIVRVQMIPNDPTQTVYKNLLKLITVKQIEENTVEVLKTRAEDLAALDQPVPEKIYIDRIDYDSLIKQKLSDEDLFKLKMLVFETEVMIDSKDRTLKSKIRKSKDPLEVISLYHSAIQTASK